jgi:hypothetical protein
LIDVHVVRSVDTDCRAGVRGRRRKSMIAPTNSRAPSPDAAIVRRLGLSGDVGKDGGSRTSRFSPALRSTMSRTVPPRDAFARCIAVSRASIIILCTNACALSLSEYAKEIFGLPTLGHEFGLRKESRYGRSNQ